MAEEQKFSTDAAADTGDAAKKPIWLRLWPVYIIVGGALLAWRMGWLDYLTLESLRANIDTFDALVADNFPLVLAGFVLLYAVITLFMIPGSVVTIAGGALFGLTAGVPIFGTIGTVLGATLGASCLFFAAKTSIGEVLRDIAGPFLGKMEQEFADSPVSYMFVLRLVPAVPFAVANIAPALLGAKFRHYVLTTFFGIIPGTMAYSWIGAAAAEFIRDDTIGTDDTAALIGSLASKVTPALIALFVVALIPLAYKKFFKKKTAAAS